ncbi:hypothetical protein ABZ921_01945 [Streptomyces atriruber]|uniref:Uncharacterized protein n=1 Tax=Streptomyces atriruber TaxID=545121 RepID=A0ABV3BEC9_9ACTN
MNFADMIGPEHARVVGIRRELEAAVANVVESARAVTDFGPLGTAELPAAISALESSTGDPDEGAAQWVSHAYTAPVTLTELVEIGEAERTFGVSIGMMRAKLQQLAQALDALDRADGDTL